MKFDEWLKTAFPNKGNNTHTSYSIKDMNNAFYAGKMHGLENGDNTMENETKENEEMIEEVTTTVTTKKVGKAKITSLIAQIVAALWVAVWSGKRFFDGGGTTTDIIFSGFAIAGCFSPVYFNMILDKLRSIKFGEN